MGTVAAALIAGAVALVAALVALSGFLISKDLKTSEFRQAWINDQRRDLATVITEARKIARMPYNLQARSSLTKFDEAYARLMLRENPIKLDWELPLTSIESLRRMMAGAWVTPVAAEVMIGNIIFDARDLLKAEWDIVRDGEPTYRTARRFLPPLIGVALLMCLAAGVLAYKKDAWFGDQAEPVGAASKPDAAPDK